jgi:hypothetical protein
LCAFVSLKPGQSVGGDELISRKPRLLLGGDYWTEWRTRCRIETQGYSKHLYDDFRSACQGQYS